MTVDSVQETLQKRAISRSAFMVMLGGLFSILAGFFSQMIIAAYFGTSAEMDAYLTALVIPAYIQVVLLAGFSFVFIPAFIREESKGNQDAAWELAGTFFWITAGVFTALAIIGSFFSKEIISLTAPGFGLEKSRLAARMLSILMFSVPFSALSSYTTDIQNARGSFFWPSFAGAVNSIANILTVVLLTPFIGPMALSWGFFIAILAQSCITIFPVLQHGWQRLLPLSDSRILEMAKLIVPFILFGMLTSATSILERYFASALPSGQISYLAYAGKISSIFRQLLASGIASAIFPAMARTYAQGAKKGLEEKTIYGLRLTLAVALPAVLVTGALAIPLVRVLFERGEFHSGDTYYVAQAVMIVMMSGVLCGMFGNIIGRAFYVLKDTLTPAIISAVSVLIYIALGRYFASQWEYIGLSYASLVRHIVSVLVLYIFLMRRLPGIASAKTLRSAFAYSLGAVGAFFIGKLLVTNLAFLPDVINFFLSGLISCIFYLIVLYLLDYEIFLSTLELFGIGRIMDLAKHLKARFIQSEPL